MTPETLTVTSSPGVTVQATVWPAASATAPVLMIWPAMGTAASYYTPLAQSLHAAGAQVMLMDLRGIGSSSVRASRRVDFGYRHLVEEDIPAAVVAAHVRFPDAPVFLLGHSLGGQVAALYASQHAESLAGLILIASGSIHFSAWPGLKSWGILAFSQFATGLGQVVGYFPGKRVGFGGREARTLIRDWARAARTGQFRPRGTTVVYEAALGKVQLPVLGITFEHDQFAPREAQRRVLAKLAASRITQLHLRAADTGGIPLNHFSWVRKPQTVTPRVMNWLETTLRSR